MSVIERTVRGKKQWWIHVVHRFPDGSTKEVRRKAPQDTKASAVRFERKVRNALEDGSYEQFDPKHTVESVADELLRSLRLTKKQASVDWYSGHLKVHVLPVLGSRSVHTITTGVVEKFAEGLKEGRSEATVNGVLRVLRRVLRFAHERDYLKKLPKLPKLKQLPRKDVQLSREQVDALLAAAEPGWRTLFLLAARTGLRAGELCALRWDAVDLKNRQLHVRLAASGHGKKRTEGLPKSNQIRTVPLTSDALAALQHQKQTHGGAGADYVFTHPEEGGPLDRRMLRAPMERMVKASKVPRITTHGLRHLFGSHLVERGASLVDVRDLMGHSALQITERYLHSRPSRLEGAVKLLEPEATPAERDD